MANTSYQNINLFWMALAGTGINLLIIDGRRMGMGKQLSHACLTLEYYTVQFLDHE